MEGKQNRNNPPLFVPPEKGEMILDIVKNSPAEKMGLGSGDVIISINGKTLEKPGELQEILSEYPTYIWMTIKTATGKKNVEFNAFPKGTNTIGAILVPRDTSSSYVVVEQANIIDRIKRFFRKKN